METKVPRRRVDAALIACALACGARVAAQEIVRAAPGVLPVAAPAFPFAVGASAAPVIGAAPAIAVAPPLAAAPSVGLAAIASALVRAVLPSAASAPAGAPGPGVGPEHVAALQRLADDTRLTWFAHGPRQTGASAPEAGAALGLGVVGGREALASAAAAPWDSVPNARRPDRLEASAEDAAGQGLLVVAPRAREPFGELGRQRRLAAPLRTTRQLARLAQAPRADGERFRFAVIGDAEPGRFWIWRALFNRDSGAFWRLLGRADGRGPDFIMQLGDMVSRGVLRNFREFLDRLLAQLPRAPYLTVIGNHDRHQPHGISNDRVYRALFGGTDYFFDRGGWRFVVADTSAGRLTPDQLAWLSRVVEAGRPTIVFTHMPPAPLGEWTDYGRLKGAGGFKDGAAEFMSLMSARGVKRVYVGHVHGLGVLDRGGVRYVLTGGGGSPLFPGPVKRRLHHSLDVEVGPDGVAETVRPLEGSDFVLR